MPPSFHARQPCRIAPEFFSFPFFSFPFPPRRVFTTTFFPLAANGRIFFPRHWTTSDRLPPFSLRDSSRTLPSSSERRSPFWTARWRSLLLSFFFFFSPLRKRPNRFLPFFPGDELADPFFSTSSPFLEFYDYNLMLFSERLICALFSRRRRGRRPPPFFFFSSLLADRDGNPFLPFPLGMTVTTSCPLNCMSAGGEL